MDFSFYGLGIYLFSDCTHFSAVLAIEMFLFGMACGVAACSFHTQQCASFDLDTPTKPIG